MLSQIINQAHLFRVVSVVCRHLNLINANGLIRVYIYYLLNTCPQQSFLFKRQVYNIPR